MTLPTFKKILIMTTNTILTAKIGSTTISIRKLKTGYKVISSGGLYGKFQNKIDAYVWFGECVKTVTDSYIMTVKESTTTKEL